MFTAYKLLYTLGIKNVECHSIKCYQQEIIFEATLPKKHHYCSSCGSCKVHFRGKRRRKFRMVPWGRKPCFLDLRMHRVFCQDCQKRTCPPLDFAKGKERMTQAFVCYVLDLLKLGTVLGVAKLLGVGWDLVKTIHKKHLQKNYQSIPWEQLEYLSVDEFSIRKGHRYMTIFVDIKTGRIIHAIEGRDRSAILPFLKELAKHASHLKAIAMDMSGPYTSAVSEVLPHVDIVFDHFHVNALVNRALDDIRRQQQQNLNNQAKRVIKGKRFLLLKNYHDLDPSAQEGLQALLDANAPLLIAHTLKEQFRLFWVQTTQKKASDVLMRWIREVYESGLGSLIKVAKTLLRHARGLVNYFKHRISNGKIEGINNKIKTISRQAYGFRDIEYFKLRLLHLHEQTYTLTG